MKQPFDSLKYKLLWKLIEQPKRRLSRFFWYTLLKKDNAFMIQRKVNKYRNQLMLDDISGVIKLLGWTDQFESDYYYIVQSRRYGVKENIFLYSCVGSFIPLKGKLSKFDYMRLEQLWDMNTLTDIDRELKEKELILK
jgi:hypothetical protein